MANSKLHCIPGDTIWVVERDEMGDPADIAGVLYCATAVGYVMATAFPDHGGINTIMKDAAEDTAQGFSPSFYVYPEEDCYQDKADAEKQLGEEPE